VNGYTSPKTNPLDSLPRKARFHTENPAVFATGMTNDSAALTFFPMWVVRAGLWVENRFIHAITLINLKLKGQTNEHNRLFNHLKCHLPGQGADGIS
jgi:hypothetical protein